MSETRYTHTFYPICKSNRINESIFQMSANVCHIFHINFQFFLGFKNREATCGYNNIFNYMQQMSLRFLSFSDFYTYFLRNICRNLFFTLRKCRVAQQQDALILKYQCLNYVKKDVYIVFMPCCNYLAQFSIKYLEYVAMPFLGHFYCRCTINL